MLQKSITSKTGIGEFAVEIAGLSKIYASGFHALDDINLTIRRGEIFALLGPNGAGKTTLISIVCGIVNATAGTIHIEGADVLHDYRAARSLIGLVPQELTTDAFETVWATVSFSRGLFGKAAKPEHIEQVLRQLSLWDKRDSKIMALSGGMKRRVLIAKALSHEPQILFLDEPTAGVDVELRRDMWRLVRALSDSGVTVILTTHYLEEAEELADRIGVMRRGKLLLVEEKALLMQKLGRRQVVFTLSEAAAQPTPRLAALPVTWSDDGLHVTYSFGAAGEAGDIDGVLRALAGDGLHVAAIESKVSSLEDIFVELIREPVMNVHGIRAIYRFEMARTFRTLLQSIVSPVISTSLYFIVFGGAIGSRMSDVDGVSYGAFIVPGLVMLSLLTQSISNASFGIYFPRFVGTIYELLSAPISALEIVLGYVGAAATKSIALGLIILVTAALFVPLQILHPIWMIVFLILTATTFSLFGFIIGLWADGFEKLQLIPLLIVTPLTFLGGSFYTIDMLPPLWQKVALFNPVVYLVSGFRWSFFGKADVNIEISVGMTFVFLALCLAIVGWMFRTGYGLRK